MYTHINYITYNVAGTSTAYDGADSIDQRVLEMTPTLFESVKPI